MERDYERWPNLGRPPKTLHEHFRADSRGADSYPKWIEDRIWELLSRPGMFVCELNGARVGYRLRRIGRGVEHAMAYAARGEYVRLQLLDGTVIREWPAGASEAGKGRASKRADRAVE